MGRMEGRKSRPSTAEGRGRGAPGPRGDKGLRPLEPEGGRRGPPGGGRGSGVRAGGSPTRSDASSAPLADLPGRRGLAAAQVPGLLRPLRRQHQHQPAAGLLRRRPGPGGRPGLPAARGPGVPEDQRPQLLLLLHPRGRGHVWHLEQRAAVHPRRQRVGRHRQAGRYPAWAWLSSGQRGSQGDRS